MTAPSAEPGQGATETSRISLAAGVFYLCGVLWLLVGPRVDVASVAGSTVRLEDLVLAVFWLIALSKFRALIRLSLTDGVALVTAAAILSYLINVGIGRIDAGGGLLFAVRFTEYWAVLPAGLIAAASLGAGFTVWAVRLLAAVTVIQTVVAVLQSVVGVEIGFSKFTYERAAGLTAGPYELGAICAALAIFWLARRNYLMAVAATVSVVLSGSRISLLALVAGVCIWAVAAGINWLRTAESRTRRRERAVRAGGITVLAVIVVGILGATPMADPVVDRIRGTSITENWSAGAALADKIPPPVTSAEFNTAAYTDIRTNVDFESDTSDVSNLVRFFRWNLLLDSMNDATSWIFGLGPSFAGVSVDGSYLRILVETGVVGLGAWVVMFWAWFRRSTQWMVAVTVSLLLGAIFVDILFSMRVMVLFWLLLLLSMLSRAGSRTDNSIHRS